MAYEGYEVPIALGAVGLHTDGPQSQLPPNAAIVANNVTFYTGTLSKSPGTSIFTTTALGSAVVAATDWWPDASPSHQRMIAITANGKVWRDTGDGSFTSQTPLNINETQWLQFSIPVTGGTCTFRFNGNNASIVTNGTDSTTQVQTAINTITGLGSATVTGNWSQGFTVTIPGTSTSQPLITTSASALTGSGAAASTMTVTHILAGATNLGACTPSAMMVAGGNEVNNNPRRLFIYSGTSQVAMITGDGGTVTGLTRPAADWASSYPTIGLIYNSRHVGMGNPSAPHTIYISRLGDHTDFTTSETDGTAGAQYSIFPGEGDGIYGACVFKGALLIFKKPFGMYMLQWNGADITSPANISISKISDSFALSSPHGLTQVLNDLVGGSASGSIFSQSATNAFGSLEAGDIFQQMSVRNYFRQNFAYNGIPLQHAIYYPDKLIAMFSGRDGTISHQNRIIMYDAAGSSPRISVETKDEPACLFLRKDSNSVPRPYYGSDDGNIYAMDHTPSTCAGTWNTSSGAYTGEFQTPYIDFSYLDPKLSEKVKLFDFLAVTYQGIGNWNFYIDVYVDGAFIQTLTYKMQTGSAALDTFVLDLDTLGSQGGSVFTQRQRLRSCSGKTISFRIYNGIANQSFTLERLVISFRESGEQARSSK